MKTVSLAASTFVFCLTLAPQLAHAQMRGVPNLSGTGIQGSAGIGFTDFSVLSPKADMKIDRGTYVAGTVEKGFDVFNLYLTLTISNMQAEGVSNYNYTNLSSSATYTANDVAFRASMFDLGLGLKMKLIDNFWFRPYVEGGGLGGYHEISYTSKAAELSAQGSDYKQKDVVMGSGYYAEGGIEVQFGARFGVKLAARMSEYTTKELETLNKQTLNFRTETYYFAGLMGF